MEFYPARHEQSGLSAACLEDGSIAIRRGAEVLSTLRLFVDGFRARYSEWLVEPRLEFSPDGAWLAISYGMGYVYLVEPQTGRVVRELRLFDDVRYEDGSFQDIDTYCYYNEHTRLDFSPSGRWLAVRVRGDFDPQEEDGRTEYFTPLYFRSVFAIDMDRRELAFSHAFDDERPGHENLAVLAFHPAEELLAVGAPGGRFRLLSLPEGRVTVEFSGLIWVPTPAGSATGSWSGSWTGTPWCICPRKRQPTASAGERTEYGGPPGSCPRRRAVKLWERSFCYAALSHRSPNEGAGPPGHRGAGGLLPGADGARRPGRGPGCLGASPARGGRFQPCPRQLFLHDRHAQKGRPAPY